MIDSFKGEYDWLSNFYVHPNGYSAEHEFQAAKSSNDIDMLWVLSSPTPAVAKKRGRLITLRSDWDDIKLLVMEEVVRRKFKIPELREKLLATGEEELVEGNWWGDQYWGVCDGIGENHLGQILMKIRKEIQESNEEKNAAIE